MHETGTRAILLRELEVGFNQADAGEFVEWDPEEIKAEGRRRMVANGGRERADDRSPA